MADTKAMIESLKKKAKLSGNNVEQAGEIVPYIKEIVAGRKGKSVDYLNDLPAWMEAILYASRAKEKGINLVDYLESIRDEEDPKAPGRLSGSAERAREILDRLAEDLNI